MGSSLGYAVGEVGENTLKPMFHPILNKFITLSVSKVYFQNGIPVPLMVNLPKSNVPSTAGSALDSITQEYVNSYGDKK